MREHGKEQRVRSGRSLNLVLWFAFSAFALLVVVIFVLVQNSLITRQYRESTFTNISEARERMIAEIGSAQNASVLGLRLTDIANDYGLSVYLFYENGESALEFDDANHRDLADMLVEQKANGGLPGFLITQSVVSYAEEVSLEGRSTFLFVSASVQQYGELALSMQWLSIITALVAVVLAFVTSGFVAAFITKPVTEVTERAKELARGNYDLHFKKNYFCAELTELAEALDYARSEISKADTMQKELIANVSHDFKTPLTMIKAYASMIQDFSGEDPEKRNKHAQVIIDESDRLAALVNDMLDLSKIRAGLEALKTSLFNLSDYLRMVVSRFDYLTETAGYRFVTDIADDLYVEADKDKIGQVLYNLIGNAVNYTGEDKTVTVRLYGENGIVHFTVTDTGKGISPEEIDTIWERYYRSRETHKRPVKGTGLGLSIVKTILTKHRFAFGVRSEVGKGSTFYVDFPARTVAELKE